LTVGQTISQSDLADGLICFHLKMTAALMVSGGWAGGLEAVVGFDLR